MITIIVPCGTNIQEMKHTLQQLANTYALAVKVTAGSIPPLGIEKMKEVALIHPSEQQDVAPTPSLADNDTSVTTAPNCNASAELALSPTQVDVNTPNWNDLFATENESLDDALPNTTTTPNETESVACPLFVDESLKRRIQQTANMVCNASRSKKANGIRKQSMQARLYSVATSTNSPIATQSFTTADKYNNVQQVLSQVSNSKSLSSIEQFVRSLQLAKVEQSHSTTILCTMDVSNLSVEAVKARIALQQHTSKLLKAQISLSVYLLCKQQSVTETSYNQLDVDMHTWQCFIGYGWLIEQLAMTANIDLQQNVLYFPRMNKRTQIALYHIQHEPCDSNSQVEWNEQTKHCDTVSWKTKHALLQFMIQHKKIAIQ